MRCVNLQCVVALLCANVNACGSPPPASQPSANADDRAESAKAEPSNAKSDEAAEPVTTAATEAKPDAPADNTKPSPSAGQRPIDEACRKLTERTEQKCTKQVASLYAVSCRRYVKATKCEQELVRAVECQLKATDDLLCAHQADPKCSEAARELKICEKGTAPGEQTQPEDLTLPAGWEKIDDSKLGFTVAMPRGTSLDAAASRRTWKAEESGIAYLVADVEPPAGKLNSAAVLRTITNYIGTRCQSKLKVHGQLETKGTTLVLYDSVCSDGTEWHGMMHFWIGKAVSTGLHGPAGCKGVREPYFYSFALAP